MEFLVHIRVHWPPDGDTVERDRLAKAESMRAIELIESGIIQRLWRIPGQWANYGVWCAKDATQLHQALSSLPFYPWLEVEVIPLAEHPSDPGGQTRTDSN